MKTVMLNGIQKIKKISRVVLLLLLAVSMAAGFGLWPAPAAYAADYEDEPEEESVTASGLVIDAEELSLYVGDEALLTVTVQPEGAACPPLEWISSDESVVSVDEEGLVTAADEGVAEITVTGGGMTDTCDITVSAAPTFMIQLASDEVTLAQHDTLALEIASETEDAGKESVSWVSSDSDVASVDAAGNVTACCPGVATISVSAGIVTDTCTVTVVPCEIQSSRYLVDRENGLLKGVRLNTTVDDLKSRLDNDADFIEVIRDGERVESGRIGTGMDVRLVVNKAVKDELNVSVPGDVDGDGLTSVYEYTMARMYLLGKSVLDADPELYDLNADGRVSITDYMLIRLNILGVIPDGDDLSGFPEIVPALKASALGCSATLSWDAVPDAGGYELLRSGSASGPFVPVGTASGGTLSFTDNTLAMESSYYYKLLAYRTLDGVRVDTQYSAVKSVSTPNYTVYYQGDPKWGFSSSVRKSACVITAYAVTINNMGTPCTPPDIYKSNGNQTPMKIDNLKKNFGVKPVSGLGSSSKYLASFDGAYTFIKNPSSNYEAAVKEALARNPEGVILYFKKGSDAHAVVACKLSDGKIYYSDPGRNRTTLVDFSETWCKVGHNMSYIHLAYMIALDRS